MLCCLPLGIVALVFVLNAKNCVTKEEFESKMKVARTCNIVALVLGAVVVVCYIVYFVVIMGAIGSHYY